MSQFLLKQQTLTDIADAIRSKSGSSDLIAIEDLDDAIKSLSGSGSRSSIGSVWGLQLPIPYENATYNTDEVVTIVRSVFQEMVDLGGSLYYLQFDAGRMALEFTKANNVNDIPIQTVQLGSYTIVLAGVAESAIEFFASMLEIDRELFMFALLSGEFGAIQTMKITPPVEFFNTTKNIPVYVDGVVNNAQNNITYSVATTPAAKVIEEGITIETAPYLRISVTQGFW